MEGEPEDLGGFAMPMDFEMPDFSSIGRTMKMMSWLPAIISCVTVTYLTFLALVIYNGLAQSDYDMTYGAFMIIILISVLAGLVCGGLVKLATRKKSAFGF